METSPLRRALVTGVLLSASAAGAVWADDEASTPAERQPISVTAMRFRVDKDVQPPAAQVSAATSAGMQRFLQGKSDHQQLFSWSQLGAGGGGYRYVVLVTPQGLSDGRVEIPEAPTASGGEKPLIVAGERRKLLDPGFVQPLAIYRIRIEAGSAPITADQKDATRVAVRTRLTELAGEAQAKLKAKFLRGDDMDEAKVIVSEQHFLLIDVAGQPDKKRVVGKSEIHLLAPHWSGSVGNFGGAGTDGQRHSVRIELLTPVGNAPEPRVQPATVKTEDRAPQGEGGGQTTGIVRIVEQSGEPSED